MSIPDVITANDPPHGSDEPHGIIYSIRQKVTNDNILNHVIPTARHPQDGHCSISTFVKWDSFCMSTSDKGSYIEIEFKDRFVFPTFYSFKGHTKGYVAKEWNLYGLVSQTDTPELIATNTTEGSTYCSPGSYGYCSNDNWGTFAIHGAKKAYRYFRIENKVPSFSGYYRVNMKALEIFGILSKDGRTLEKATKYPKTNQVTLCLQHFLFTLV